MNKFIWLILFLIVVLVNSGGNFQDARYLVAGLGMSLPSFVLGLVLSPIWWGLTKKSRENSWEWFDWLNVASYIMVVVNILSFFVKVNI
jgi:hypothetical protein